MNYAELMFPLNVYAQALQLEEGRADYIHYGLFRNSETPICEALQRSTEEILERLPKPPCRLLEIGMGLGTTLGLLAGRGYSVTGINPDPQQAAIAKTRAGPEARCVRFEDLDADDGQFDVLLLQESAQYLDPLMLFNKARELLADNGQILLLDEVELVRRGPEAGGLHLLPHLLAQADRCGFSCEEQTDLSKQAVPTLAYMLKTLSKHREALCRELMLDEPQLKQLEASLRLYEEKYRDGRCGYVLLRLQKRAQPRWLPANADESCKPAVQALFQEAFGETMSDALWQWKYRDGGGHAILVWNGENPVGHYGGMPRDIRFRGNPAAAIQIGDVMVLPSERGVITQKGAFFLAAATFLERYIGYGTHHLLGFGFPNQRIMRLAERLGLYAETGKIMEIRCSVLSGGFSFTGIRPLRPDSPDLHTLETLWDQMRTDLKDAIVGVRDWARIHYRYLTHPEKSYTVLLVYNRITRAPQGIIVLRKEETRCLLLDIIGPLNKVPLLLIHARRVAGEWKSPELYTWMSEPYASRFFHGEGITHCMELSIPACAWSPGPSAESLQDAWWLMAGDTDFL
ncbi:MAG: GNAT family N-acetyltransferase [Gammaproteobacteria bacterium]|nr:GNAT family N-acetyltransferase [Gammaproteobacteria bacterium]